MCFSRLPLASKERDDPTQDEKQAEDHGGDEGPGFWARRTIGIGKIMTAVRATYGILVNPLGALGTLLEIIFRGLIVFVPPRGGFVGHVLAFRASDSKRVASSGRHPSL